VSAETGIHQGTLRHWRAANDGRGPESFTLGRKVMYRRSEVERWIAEQVQATRRGGKSSTAVA
jgi:predicted DNA-binding transcriptional regulator AlpA